MISPRSLILQGGPSTPTEPELTFDFTCTSGCESIDAIDVAVMAAAAEAAVAFGRSAVDVDDDDVTSDMTSI